MLGRRQILNAFLPATEIDEPRRFAGRRAQVAQALDALLTEGAHLFVYGQRGIGKSSFALQVVRLARGEDELLRALGLPALGRGGPRFLCLEVRCDDSVADLDQLLARVLASEGLSGWVEGEETRRLVEDVRQFSVLPSGMGARTEHKATVELERVEVSVPEAFRRVVRALDADRPEPDGILLLLDEFDRVVDTRGFASLLKSLADTGLKCLVVGVADTLAELVDDHASLQRQMAEGSIHLPPMSVAEAVEIIDRVEEILGHALVFHADTKQRIAGLSRGQPYLVQLFGKWSLLQAWERGDEVVQLAHLDAALGQIATRGYVAELEERYRAAVRGSAARESVLRAFAVTDQDAIHSSEAYASCPEVGPDRAAAYLGHLIAERYGAELVDRGHRYYGFRDPLFKAYVSATPRRTQAGTG